LKPEKSGGADSAEAGADSAEAGAEIAAASAILALMDATLAKGRVSNATLWNGGRVVTLVTPLSLLARGAF